MDPVTIAGIAFSAIGILTPLVEALTNACIEGGSVHQTLDELRADTTGTSDLLRNICQILNEPAFVQGVEDVQRGTRTNLLENLERHLQSCHAEAERLRDLLSNLGIGRTNNRIKQSILQYQLDRRMDDIIRVKQRFQDHRSSIQLALQVVTICKQMQTAERDAQQIEILKALIASTHKATARRDESHVLDLKAQLSELCRATAESKAQMRDLQNMIQQFQQQIKDREVEVMDEEQTRLLDDMQDMQTTSVKVQRRATMRLQALTAIAESTPIADFAIRKPPPPLPPRKKIFTSNHKQPSSETTMDSQETFTPSRDDLGKISASRPTSEDIIANSAKVNQGDLRETQMEIISNSPAAASSSAIRPLSSLEMQSLESSNNPGSELSVMSHTLLPKQSKISSQEFEIGFQSVMTFARERRMGAEKPFSDELITRTGDLLISAGKQAWGERPRTYIVLRMIDETRVMDDFIFEGFKDIHFPYTEATLPSCLKSLSSRHSFLQKQRYVLSPRSADLVQGGRHHHLDKGADAYFASIGKLGQGGFSIVDRVRSSLNLQEYARKRIDRTSMFAKDRKALEFLENEMRILKRLSHFHLVKFVGSYTDKKHVGIIMEPVAETDLRRHLGKETWNSDELVTLRSFVGCLSSALAYLHQQKCRHKDIKPQNILIKGNVVLIADFGLSLDWNERGGDTTTGRPEAYTEVYIAPEVGLRQARKSASDIWSLGCIFLEIATVLAGKNLAAKTELFKMTGSTDVAYWCNSDGVDAWISQLSRSSGTDEILLGWTRWMMCPNANERPAAETLMTRIHTTHVPGVRYGGSCCFEDPASDNTSWAGSASGDETFEPTSFLTEQTKLSSGSSRVLSAQSSIVLAPEAPTRISHDIAKYPVRSRDPVLGITGIDSSIHISSQVASSTTLRGNNLAGFSSPSLPDQTTFPMQPRLAAPPPQSARIAVILPFRSQREHSDNQENIENASHSAASPGKLPAVAQSTAEVPDPIDLQPVDIQTQERTVEVEVPVSLTPLAEAFQKSHKDFEHLLLAIRDEDMAWKEQLDPWIQLGISDNKGFKLLHVSSSFNDESLARDVIELVLQKTPEASKQLNLFRNSALHFTAFHNRALLLKYLVKGGADPTIANVRGQTPLHIAVRKQSSQAVKELIRNLTEEMICAQDDSGQTPLHLACDVGTPLELILDLLVAGAQPNIPDRQGKTPIDLSIGNDRADFTDILLAHSYRSTAHLDPPPPYQTTISPNSTLEPYYAECNCEICLLLVAVSQLDANESVVNMCTCKHHLIILGQDTLSDMSRIATTFETCDCKGCETSRQRNAETQPCVPPNQYADDFDDFFHWNPFGEEFGSAPLLEYPGHKHYDDLIDEVLLNKDEDLTSQEISNLVLDTFADAGFRNKYSYRNNPEKVLAWVMSNCSNLPYAWKMVEMLLDCGARPDTMDKSGCTALHAAARHDDVALAQVLIERGATIDMPRQARLAQKAYYTPSRYALWFNSPLVLRQLLKAGANPNDQSVYERRTLLHQAVWDFYQSGWHIPMLLAHGVWLHVPDENSNTALYLSVVHNHVYAALALLEAGADVEATGENGSRPLAMALEKGNRDMITLLLSHGADIHARCNDMPCALFLAVLRGHVEIVAILLEEYSGADDIHRTDLNGRGVLHVLSNSTIDNILKNLDLLIAYGADVHLEDNSGSTPLHEAAKVGSATMIDGLLDNGAMPNAQNRAGKTPLALAQAKKHRECVELLGGSLKVRKKRWFSRG